MTDLICFHVNLRRKRFWVKRWIEIDEELQNVLQYKEEPNDVKLRGVYNLKECQVSEAVEDGHKLIHVVSKQDTISIQALNYKHHQALQRRFFQSKSEESIVKPKKNEYEYDGVMHEKVLRFIEQEHEKYIADCWDNTITWKSDRMVRNSYDEQSVLQKVLRQVLTLDIRLQYYFSTLIAILLALLANAITQKYEPHNLIFYIIISVHSIITPFLLTTNQLKQPPFVKQTFYIAQSQFHVDESELIIALTQKRQLWEPQLKSIQQIHNNQFKFIYTDQECFITQTTFQLNQQIFFVEQSANQILRVYLIENNQLTIYSTSNSNQSLRSLQYYFQRPSQQIVEEEVGISQVDLKQSKYEEIIQKCQDLFMQTIQLDASWQQKQNSNGFKIHIKLKDNLTLVRAEGIIPHDIETIKELIGDPERRGEYDELFKEGKLLEQLDSEMKIIYQRFKNILVVSGRDFVALTRVVKLDQNKQLLIGKSIDYGYPLTSAVRGEIVLVGWLLEKLSEKVTSAIFLVWADPKGSIPGKIINIAATIQGKVIENVKRCLDQQRVK